MSNTVMARRDLLTSTASDCPGPLSILCSPSRYTDFAWTSYVSCSWKCPEFCPDIRLNSPTVRRMVRMQTGDTTGFARTIFEPWHACLALRFNLCLDLSLRRPKRADERGESSPSSVSRCP